MKRPYTSKRSAKDWRKAKLNRTITLAIGRAKAWADKKRRLRMSENA